MRERERVGIKREREREKKREWGRENRRKIWREKEGESDEFDLILKANKNIEVINQITIILLLCFIFKR